MPNMLALLCILFLTHSSADAECPTNCVCDSKSLKCHGMPPENIPTPNAVFQYWPGSNVDFSLFENSTTLKELSISGDAVETFTFSEEFLPRLEYLALTNCPSLTDSRILRQIITHLPHLQRLDLSRNAFSDIDFKDEIGSELKTLSLQGNKLENVSQLVSPSLETLDLSSNRLTSVENVELVRGRHLNLRSNRIEALDMDWLSRNLPRVQSLDLSHNPLDTIEGSSEEHRNLRSLNMSHANFLWLSFKDLGQELTTLDLSNNARLQFVSGSVMDRLQHLDFSGSNIRYFPANSFNQHIPPLLNLTHNPLECQDQCLLEWTKDNEALLNITCPDGFPTQTTDCSFSIRGEDQLVLGAYGAETTLHCDIISTDPHTIVTWTRLTPGRHPIGWKSSLEKNVSEPDIYDILPNGDLLVRELLPELKGDLECSANSSHNASSVIFQLRLDYSSWTIQVKVFSVFCGIGTALGFFLLNVVWAGIRSFIMWRISQSEKKGRIRRMLEALENYRIRQAESLQEKYTQRMNLIRDNYNSQAEQLRRSYTSQAGRFRDYKTQQMEHVSQQIDSLRDNYSAQMSRMRDYGSRQMERVYENYQRQMNRIRTFTLQQRLRMMHQYKVKQRYVNILLDSLNAAQEPGNSDICMPTLAEGDEDLLDIPVPRLDMPEDAFSVSTYHSLPPEQEQLLHKPDNPEQITNETIV